MGKSSLPKTTINNRTSRAMKSPKLQASAKNDQRAITSFFTDASRKRQDSTGDNISADESSSAHPSPSKPAEVAVKRKRVVEKDVVPSATFDNKATKRNLRSNSTIDPSINHRKQIAIGIRSDSPEEFAIPASKLPKQNLKQEENSGLMDEDLVPDEGEEYVRPPELQDGEDDDFWQNCSDSSGTLRGESVFSDSDNEESREIHEEKSIGETSETVCPICSVTLEGFSLSEAERHVNGCLDGSSSTTLPTLSTGRPHPTKSHPRPLNTTGPLPSSSKIKLSDKTSDSHQIKPPKKPIASESNAFGALMRGKKEENAWRLSEQDSNHYKKEKQSMKRSKMDRSPVNVPFYKIMEGTSIAVDAFKYGKIPNITAYFLSHAHADHYTRLSHTWDHGFVYCSQTTANLICHNLGVKKQWVKPLKDNEPTMVDGVKVTVLDANHCPGSSLFLFEGVKQQGKPFRYLHCGDFRASPAQLRHPALKDKKIDICYLDTTYLNPKYCFPAQEQVINACSDLVKSRVVDTDKTALKRGNVPMLNKDTIKSGALLKGWLNAGQSVKEETEITKASIDILEEPKDVKPVIPETKDMGPKIPRIFQMGTKANSLKSKDESILVLIGTYTIGKERIVKQIAKSIGSKIYCDTRKSLIFKCIEDPELHELMTDDPFKAQVHVTNLFAIKNEMLEEYLRRFRGHFTHIIGLRPTGWTYKPDAITSSAHPPVPKVLEMFRPSNGSEAEAGTSITPAEVTQTCLYPQRDSTERCQAFGVPYSEHSSFFELTCFCVSMDWVKIIPTVNCGSPASRAKMKVWFERWQAERKRRIEASLPLFIEPRSEAYW